MKIISILQHPQFFRHSRHYWLLSRIDLQRSRSVKVDTSGGQTKKRIDFQPMKNRNLEQLDF